VAVTRRQKYRRGQGGQASLARAAGDIYTVAGASAGSPATEALPQPLGWLARPARRWTAPETC